jgi:hypothetical protein
VLGTRKKRAPVQPSEDEGYPEQRVDIPYQPLQEEAPAAVARTAPAHIPATPSPSHPAPAMTEEANAREAIDNTEKILQDAEKVGLDTKKARQSFKVARNFFDMGKFQKATLYCKTAEENIE